MSKRLQNTPNMQMCMYFVKQVVTNLQQTCSNAVPTTCQQDVFATSHCLFPACCQRLVDNLLQGC